MSLTLESISIKSGIVKSAYFVLPEFKSDFETELTRSATPFTRLSENLTLVEQASQPIYWVNQVWQDCQVVYFKSISEAQVQLKHSGIFWSNASDKFFRRAELILEKLPQFKQEKLEFRKLQTKPLGQIFMLSENSLLYSTQLTPNLPLGQFEFIENKSAPSRAYLKLWETFSLYLDPPKPGERCADFGACPGGWTWVLAQLKCQVSAFDKAPIDEKLQLLSNVQYFKQDVFNLNLANLPQFDWIFSDVICDPNKLFALVSELIRLKKAKNFVCTLKFKGPTDFTAIEKFKRLTGSRLIHLFHNKHELTWILQT